MKYIWESKNLLLLKYSKVTLKIILENPSNLVLIPKVSEKTAKTLHKQLKEYEANYEVILYLTEMGFSSRDAMIIYHHYKNETKKIIENNIYQLIDDIYEISFKKVDMIALRNGIESDDSNRVKSAICYIMNEISYTYGHSYYSFDEIMFLLPRVIGCDISYDTVLEYMTDLENDSKIVRKEDRLYLKSMYDDECFIVKRFRLLNHNREKVSKNILDELNALEEYFGITYNEKQRQAILESYKKDFLIITGGPGTGKTTIMKGILELYRQMNQYSYEELNRKVVLLAPTGRAAKRMSEATLFPASTIHRFLKWQKESNTFQVNEYHKSKAELVILDEASMVDTPLMASLLRGLSSNCRIILVGDDHQLPSVGPGQVLHDLIDSEMLEVIELTELYRQGKDSNIITLAYDIRNQYIQKDVFNQEEDLTFIECRDDKVMSELLELCRTYQDTNYHDFQILVPMYKGLHGIDLINDKVQEIFNPKDSSKTEIKIGDTIYREGDKVIQLTNMPDENVYNGDIGIIKEILPKKEIRIDYDGNVVKYTPSIFNNFKKAFAISIHKSQGSEFDIVVIPMVMGYKKMLYQKLIYTAVTRAKKRLYLIGDMEALKLASNNTNDDIRRTSIREFLINGIF